MTNYIAILRGINVSGKNIIKMAEFRELLSELDFENINTYIQSGNIVFTYKKENAGKLEEIIKNKIKEHYNYDVPVLVREAAYFNSIINNNPFLKGREEDTKFLHVTYLSEKPKIENIEKTNALDFPPDEFIINENKVFVFCPNGYGKTKINNTFFEKKLGVSATTRNWKTTLKLLEMVENI